MAFTKKSLNTLLSLVVIFIASSCGGGGGGSSTTAPASEPAYINLDVVPSEFDTGDKTTVTVYVQSVAPEGMFLKIRTPISVLYVNDSGVLEVNGVEQNINPEFYQSDTAFNYLVYIFTKDDFGPDNFGKISVQYQGTAAVASGVVAADADFNDPNVADVKEFDVTNPQFSDVESQAIVVTN